MTKATALFPNQDSDLLAKVAVRVLAGLAVLLVLAASAAAGGIAALFVPHGFLAGGGLALAALAVTAAVFRGRIHAARSAVLAFIGEEARRMTGSDMPQTAPDHAAAPQAETPSSSPNRAARRAAERASRSR